MTEKLTNPKDIIGSDKLPLHLWPSTATAMGCIGLLEGALKYGRLNWRESGVRASIYVDACKRHIDAWFEGEENTLDTGSPHLSNALACLAIIVDAKATGKLNDDRQFNGEGYRKLVDELTPQVGKLKELFKDKTPKHYTIKDNTKNSTKKTAYEQTIEKIRYNPDPGMTRFSPKDDLPSVSTTKVVPILAKNATSISSVEIPEGTTLMVVIANMVAEGYSTKTIRKLLRNGKD